MRFFTHIFDILFPPRTTERLVRDADPASLSNILNPQIISIQNEAILTLLPYRSLLVQAFIIEAKFHNNKKAQKYLGEIILSTVKTKDVVFMPLPLGARRKKERGYNQVEEILKSADLSFCANILTRARETIPQTTLGREARLQNMEGAFSIISEPDSARTYVLMDDVVTTGATLLAARKALLAAGAKEVFMLALAH